VSTVAVSVVVPTIGRLQLLEACLRSLLVCEPGPAEIVIADQSPDGHDVAALADALSSRMRVVRQPGRGIARNMNLGLREARHEIVLVTHDDCRVEPTWVGHCHRLALAYPDAVLSGRVLPGGDDAGAVPSTRTDTTPHDFTGSLESGALYPNNMVLPRTAVVEFGSFDERSGFETSAEDRDFCYRWLRAGRAVRFEPEMVVTHDDWRRPDELVDLYRHYARTAGRFYAKHLYSGDLRIAPFVLRDFGYGASAWMKQLRHWRPQWTDERLALPVHLPIGLVEGFVESFRLGRKARR
jgi:GT2 family glycosyltransferase